MKHALSFALAVSWLATSAAAQGQLVLNFGEPVPGASDTAPLNALRTPGVGNDGTWATLAGNLSFSPGFATNLLVKNGTVLLEEGVSRLEGRVVRVIEQPSVLADGRVLTICAIGSLSFPDEVVVLDDQVLLREDDTALDRAGNAIGTVGGIREAFVTDDGRVIVLAFVRPASGPSELHVLAQDITTVATLPFSIFGPGDVLPDGATVINVLGLDVSANGRVATYGSEFSPTGMARTVYRVDGDVEIQNGDPAPLPGATYRTPTSTFSSSGFAVSRSGRLGLLATVESGGVTTEIVASGDVLVTEIGQSPIGTNDPAVAFPAGAGFDMTLDEELAWVARDENLDYVVYLEGERLLAPGMPIDGSTLVRAGVGSGQPGFVHPLSTNGGFLTEIVELADGRRGLLLMQRSIGASLSCGTVPHSGGVTAAIDATGSDLAGGKPLTLVATDLPSGTFGIFLTSRVFDAGGMSVASGQLCIAGTIGRIPGVLGSGTAGSFELDVDTQRLPQSILTAAQPGETWYFQTWFRDANPTPTANFSDTVAVAFR
ncbi:MAG: hypothetical protein AAF726_19375 [Planctomycetota bacterium]